MNKKSYKIISYFILVIVLFFGIFQRVNAATLNVMFAKNKASNAKWYSTQYGAKYTSNYWFDGKSGHKHDLVGYIFFSSGTNNNNEKVVRQVYCIEQNKNLINAYTASASDTPYDENVGGNHYWDTSNEKYKNRMNLLAMAMSVGYNIEEVVTKDDSMTTAINTFKTRAAEISTAQVIAKQEIVWEIFTGTRTDFSIKNNYSPTHKSSCSATQCPFYNLLQKNSNLGPIFNAYKAIIDEGHYTFEVKPSEFGTGAKPKEYAMDYNKKTGKFVTTLNNSDGLYKYFNFKSSNSKVVEVEASKDGTKLTITSSQPLENSVKITMKSKRDSLSPRFYHSGSMQDVGVYLTNIEYALTVSTPEYQLRIHKTDKLNDSNIQGATFKICSDDKCKKVISTITTNAKGNADYKKIDKPGTYYYKETSVPAGYVLDSTIRSIDVTTNHIAGTDKYATAEVKNKNNEFVLDKKTVDSDGNITTLDDNCGTGQYIGPEFEIKNSKGEILYFKKLSDGEYELADKNTDGAVTNLQTCKGSFKVYTLTECNYTITETVFPYGYQQESNPTKNVNVCKNSDKTVTFVNGFAGLQFQKKDGNGNLLSGGVYALQQKVNNVYKDMLLLEINDGVYQYSSNLKETDSGATYTMTTNGGISLIKDLPTGDYRVVEKEAPNGYKKVEDKDSKAIVTITDKADVDYYLVEMINQKVNQSGSDAFAELIITIITGRKVPNYIFIISSLAILLVVAIIVRKKIRK